MVRDIPCPACGADSVMTAMPTYQEVSCHQCGREVAATTDKGVLTVSVELREG